VRRDWLDGECEEAEFGGQRREAFGPGARSEATVAVVKSGWSAFGSIVSFVPVGTRTAESEAWVEQ
jgi:hypothetical protein